MSAPAEISVPVAELSRIATLLHATAVAAVSNSQHVYPADQRDVLEEVEWFTALCAERGADLELDPQASASLSSLLDQIHATR